MATFDDMLIEGKLTVYDKGFDEDTRSWGEYIARSGDIFSPRIPNAEPLRLECEHFIECVRTRRDAALGRRTAGCAWCACSSALQRSLRRGLSAALGSPRRRVRAPALAQPARRPPSGPRMPAVAVRHRSTGPH